MIIRRSLIAAAVTLAAVTLMGCNPDRVLDVRVIAPDSVAALEMEESGKDRAFSLMPFATPDGYGQTVHPDYAMMPDWTPRRYIVATPYTFSDSLLENPSLYAQRTNFTWGPFGAGKPIATPRAGYLSDPDMVPLNDQQELWIYYREVTRRNTIWLIRSHDGLAWSEARRVVSAPNHMIVSPAVVRRDPTHWMMWSVNAGKAGCKASGTHVELRTSEDGLKWSIPSTVSLVQAPFFVWHIDVQWIPTRQEYWALYNVKTEGNCATQLIYLATSADGVEWKTYLSPVLTVGVIPEFSSIVYRSTFAYNPKTDNIRFWFSGARSQEEGYAWRTVYQRRSRSDVFASIAAAPGPQVRAVLARRNVPQLINPP